MSCTYLYLVKVSGFESHLVAEKPESGMDSLDDPDYDDLEPLMTALEEAIGTNLMAENHDDEDTIRIIYIDQGSAPSMKELDEWVGAEIADEVEARLGWRPSVRVEARWWGD